MGLPDTTSSRMPLFILGSTAAWTAASSPVMPASLLLSYLAIGHAAHQAGKKRRVRRDIVMLDAKACNHLEWVGSGLPYDMAHISLACTYDVSKAAVTDIIHLEFHQVLEGSELLRVMNKFKSLCHRWYQPFCVVAIDGTS